MSAAIKLFITNGFHGTPTSLIAKEAGVANGTLFNYFKTKNILINEIFIEITNNRKKSIMQGVEEDWKMKKKLKKIWKNSIVWGIENEKERKFSESYHESYLITESTKNKIVQNVFTVLKLFEDFGKKKGISKEDSLLAFFSFIGAFKFTGKYFQYMEMGYDEKVAETSFERFCKGIDLTEED